MLLTLVGMGGMMLKMQNVCLNVMFDSCFSISCCICWFIADVLS